MADVGSAWSFLHRSEQAFQHRTVALCHQLDRALRTIAHPAAEAQLARGPHDEVAEAHALDIAMHYRVKALDGSEARG